MNELILNVTLQVVGRPVTSWPRNLAVGERRGLPAQRYRRYVAGSAGHRDPTPPDLAATLVQRSSRPSDLILDPFAGTGTMLVEAVHAGRNGLGMDIEPGWVSLARTNLALAARQSATGPARIIHADATRLPTRVPTGLPGTVDLVLTSAPTGATMLVASRGNTGARNATGAWLGQGVIGCAHLLASSPTIVIPGYSRVAFERSFSSAIQQPLASRVRTSLTASAHGSEDHPTALPHREKSTYHRRPPGRARGTQPNVLVTDETPGRRSSSCRLYPSRPPRTDSCWLAGGRPVINPNHARSDVGSSVPVGTR